MIHSHWFHCLTTKALAFCLFSKSQKLNMMAKTSTFFKPKNLAFHNRQILLILNYLMKTVSSKLASSSLRTSSSVGDIIGRFLILILKLLSKWQEESFFIFITIKSLSFFMVDIWKSVFVILVESHSRCRKSGKEWRGNWLQWWCDVKFINNWINSIPILKFV